MTHLAMPTQPAAQAHTRAARDATPQPPKPRNGELKQSADLGKLTGEPTQQWRTSPGLLERLWPQHSEWEIDRASSLAHSERRAWKTAAAALLLAGLGSAAALVQGARHEWVPIPIVVDRNTGETSVVQRLSANSVPALDVLDKHNLMVFVRTREGYHADFMAHDYAQMARTSSAAVFAAYAHPLFGDSPLAQQIGHSQIWNIRILAVHLTPSRQPSKPAWASVEFERIVDHLQPPGHQERQHGTATLQYVYQPQAPARESDRLENPFGFVVLAYRSDTDLMAPHAAWSQPAWLPESTQEAKPSSKPSGTPSGTASGTPLSTAVSAPFDRLPSAPSPTRDDPPLNHQAGSLP